MTDAKDFLFNKLLSVVNPTDDYLDGVVRSIVDLHAFSPRLDYCEDKINGTLRKSDTGGGERQIDQKLGATLVFDEGEFRTLRGTDARCLSMST